MSEDRIEISPGRSCGCIHPFGLQFSPSCRRDRHAWDVREQCCWVYMTCRDCQKIGMYWLDPARVLRNVERALAKAKVVSETHPRAEYMSSDR